ncbi:MAG: chemotaxis protein CheD [Solirubrobacteraceae bacterium]
MASVRMGEIAVSRDPAEELVALGLGSCIGLAILDRTAGVAGLAHVVLPESQPGAGPAGKFADLAIPELIGLLRSAGAVDRRFETVLVGGARMFEMSGGLDIGARNEAAVRAALSRNRISVRAAETGGNKGRTVRVLVGAGVVTCRSGGTGAVTLLQPRSAGRGDPQPAATTTAGARAHLAGAPRGRR